MKQFLKHIALLFIGVIVALVLLDIIYTSTYQKSVPRTKFQYLQSLSKNDTIDYLFLGSSRVENTIVSGKIEEITGKRTLNLGTQGAKLNDMAMFLELLIAQEVKVKRIFIQVDYNYNIETSSDLVTSQALPFIRTKGVNKYFKTQDDNYFRNYYLPFYRYATNDYRIGAREFMVSLVGKPPVTDLSDGFKPVYGWMATSASVILPIEINRTNKAFEKIDSICTSNNLEVTYFCAPFCANIINEDFIEKLNGKIPNLKDFSRVIETDNLFQNCTHLNAEGAEIFTELLIRELNL